MVSTTVGGAFKATRELWQPTMPSGDYRAAVPDAMDVEIADVKIADVKIAIRREDVRFAAAPSISRIAAALSGSRAPNAATL
jgi:hypothetical protein